MKNRYLLQCMNKLDWDVNKVKKFISDKVVIKYNSIILSHDIHNLYHTFQYGCKYGKTDVIKLFTNMIVQQSFLDDCFIFCDAIHNCCKTGQLELASWLYKSVYLSHTKFYLNWSNVQWQYIFEVSCMTGQLPILQWLLTLKLNIDVHNDQDRPFAISCSRGHLDVAKWLHHEQGAQIDARYNSAFYNSCCNGHFEVAKWIYSLQPNIFKTAKNLHQIITRCCSKGHLKIARWLFKKLHRVKQLNINNEINDAFIVSCSNGQLKSAQWLYNIYNFSNKSGIDCSKFNIQADDYEAFEESCSRGHLDIARWLYSLSPPSDTCFINTFKKSCNQNQTHIAKWLYNLNQTKINIRQNNDDLFRNCCDYNCKQTAQWLTTLCSDYKLTINKKNFTYKISAWYENKKNRLYIF